MKYREQLEMAIRRCPAEKLPLKISENLQRPATFLEKGLQHRCFTVILQNF